MSDPELTTIPAKGHLLLWADNQPEQGILHLGFGLKRVGEQIGLVQYDGSTFIDSITYGKQYLGLFNEPVPGWDKNGSIYPPLQEVKTLIF